MGVYFRKPQASSEKYSKPRLANAAVRAEGEGEMKQDKPHTESGLKIGDRVKLISGTLTWSAEITLKGKIGEVVEQATLAQALQRVSVRFDNGKLLMSRDAGLFERVSIRG